MRTSFSCCSPGRGSWHGLRVLSVLPNLKGPTGTEEFNQLTSKAPQGQFSLLKVGREAFIILCLSRPPQAFFVKKTSTTVLGAPTASMVASVWTGLEATAAAACLALLGSGARGTSTNACPTPATRRAAWTAFSSPMTTCVSAAVPSPVRTSQPPQSDGQEAR